MSAFGAALLLYHRRREWDQNSRGFDLQDVDPLEAIEMELDEEEDAAVHEHLYDEKPFLLTKMVNGPSYKRWKLPLPVGPPFFIPSLETPSGRAIRMRKGV